MDQEICEWIGEPGKTIDGVIIYLYTSSCIGVRHGSIGRTETEGIGSICPICNKDRKVTYKGRKK